MILSRLHLSIDATSRLRNLKARTGMDYNIHCRIGLCYSLADGRVPRGADYDEKGLEISRLTLFGEWEPAYLALVRERCVQTGLDPEGDLWDQLRAHVNRGVIAVSARVKDLGDLADLLPQGEVTAPRKTSR
ncbi:MAG: DNA sulfur modification protein DndE [Nitrososphaerota archaeon]|nr:DNA sulfur modification protein DndE [Nitrososphaerota archaeon]